MDQQTENFYDRFLQIAFFIILIGGGIWLIYFLINNWDKILLSIGLFLLLIITFVVGFLVVGLIVYGFSKIIEHL